MAKRRRTSGIQRRERASGEALNRRIDQASGGGGGGLPDWRLLAIGGVLLVGVAIIGLVLFLGGGNDESTTLPNDGQTHIADGTTCRSPQEPCGPDPYSTLPAASGPHWSTPAAWGAYATPQNESQVIHNLEHGGIVIWYDPALVDDAQVAELTSYVQSQVASGISGRFKFLLTPWGGSEDLGAAVAVTSWRRLLKLDTLDMDAIRSFADENYLRGAPEPNGGPAP